MLASQGMNHGSAVTVVPIGFDISPLLDGDLDAMAAYLVDGPLIAGIAGTRQS